MKGKKNLLTRAVWGMLALLLLVPLLSACGGRSAAARAGLNVEENTGENSDLYPYVVHTPSATWYLAADDIALLGEEAFYEGLAAILENQELDFADAREALQGYIFREIPPVDIYTDFCGKSNPAEAVGADYNSWYNYIKLFYGWDMAEDTLLHEYVHYLTMHCTEPPVMSGFYAEAIANYIAFFACRNRMARSVDFLLSEEEQAFLREHGAWDEEEDCLDPRKLYYGQAGVEAQGGTVGTRYFSVSDRMELRTEEQQENPSVLHVSHYEAACILAYLIETQSKDTVFWYLSTDPMDMQAVYGMDFSEIYREWAAWNAAKCAELGIRNEK